jgi:hypothetical protein
VYLRRHNVEPVCRLHFSSLGSTDESSTVPDTVCERFLFGRDALGWISLPRSGEVGERAPGLEGRGELDDVEEVVVIV